MSVTGKEIGANWHVGEGKFLERRRGLQWQRRIPFSHTLQRTHSTASPRILQELQPDGQLHNAPHGSERATHGTLHSVSRSHTLRMRGDAPVEITTLAICPAKSAISPPYDCRATDPAA